MAAVLRTELYKAGVRLRTYVAFGIVIAIPVIATIALDSNPPNRPNGDNGGLFFLADHSGLIMPAAALRLMSAFLLIIIVALFGGETIAGEASWGNLRYVLVRPVRRTRLVAGKFMIAVLLSWASVVAVVLAALIAGGIAFGWHGLPSIGFFLPAQSAGTILLHTAEATGYVAWNLTGVVAFAFMVSCMTDAPAGAIFAGVGFYITSQILDNITALGNIRYVLPTHYFDAWVDLVRIGHFSDDMWRGVGLQLGYVILFFGIALWWFGRKDVLS
jgi:ABC-2 type transport system permease protein